MSTKEAREKEAKKLKYRKMGFGPMMDSGEIDFGDGKKSSLRKEKGAEIGGEAGFKFMNEKKKSFEHPMAEERFQQTAKARLKKSGLKDSEIGDPRTDIKDYDKSDNTTKGGKVTFKKSFNQGGEAHQGYGAARTSGMGLQDESIQPGKVQKAFLGKAIKKVAGIFGGKKSATMTAGGSGGSLPSVADLYQKALDDARMIKGNKTGGVMKYKRGSGLDLPVINSVKPTVNKTKRAQNLSNYKIQFNKQKSRAGVNPNSHFDKKNANVVKHTRVGGPSEFVKRRMKLTGPFSSMDEMRQAKGFKPGESNTAFLKRRMDLRAATKAVSATKIGKIALGVGAAGVAASQYLKSKMKKDEPEKKNKSSSNESYKEGRKEGSKKFKQLNEKVSNTAGQVTGFLTGKRYGGAMKKMGGGMMMQKPMGYRGGGMDMGKEPTSKMKTRETMLAYAKAKAFKNKGTRLTDKDIETVKSLIKNPRPGTLPKRFVGRNMGGMMQRPMGYRSGTMVKARGCKLGRTRPTKIT
jgi:hypothetical protein